MKIHPVSTNRLMIMILMILTMMMMIIKMMMKMIMMMNMMIEIKMAITPPIFKLSAPNFHESYEIEYLQ